MLEIVSLPLLGAVISGLSLLFLIIMWIKNYDVDGIVQLLMTVLLTVMVVLSFFKLFSIKHSWFR